MKIKWLAGAKQVPTIGRVNTGQIFTCDKDTGESLVRQGLAEKYSKEVKKGINPPDEADKKELIKKENK